MYFRIPTWVMGWSTHLFQKLCVAYTQKPFGLFEGVANFQLMAFSATPSGWLGAGYTLSGSGTTAAINFGISGNTNETLPEITTAEANATTGDIRKIYYGIVEKLYQAYLAKPTADRPNRLSLSKSSNVDSTTGLITTSYTIQFVLAATGLDVTNESA
jgi:hypothetical protein